MFHINLHSAVLLKFAGLVDMTISSPFLFNSQTRKEAIEFPVQLYPIEYFSTHGLTKRSTRIQNNWSSIYFVSTHDLTRRSTALLYLMIIAKYVSTHDLTRRSTISPEGAV